MGKAAEPMIKDFSGKDFTCITFKPDLAKFKMETLDSDTVALLTRRAYDVAGSVRGIAVYLNGKKLPVCFIKGFVQFPRIILLIQRDGFCFPLHLSIP